MLLFWRSWCWQCVGYHSSKTLLWSEQAGNDAMPRDDTIAMYIALDSISDSVNIWFYIVIRKKTKSDSARQNNKANFLFLSETTNTKYLVSFFPHFQSHFEMNRRISNWTTMNKTTKIHRIICLHALWS